MFHEDNNNDDNESVTNNIDRTKTLQNNNNDQINKDYYARKYDNDKNKNTGKLEVVINQYPENQTVYPSKHIVLGTNSCSETLATSQTNCHNIKIFSDSIPKGIWIKQMNQ